MDKCEKEGRSGYFAMLIQGALRDIFSKDWTIVPSDTCEAEVGSGTSPSCREWKEGQRHSKAGDLSASGCREPVRESSAFQASFARLQGRADERERGERMREAGKGARNVAEPKQVLEAVN
jgi:hypothetical protein